MSILHIPKLFLSPDVWLRYLYVLGAQATSVEILALEAPGQSKLIASVDVMGPARAAGVEISEFIYVSLVRPQPQILTPSHRQLQPTSKGWRPMCVSEGCFRSRVSGRLFDFMIPPF